MEGSGSRSSKPIRGGIYDKVEHLNHRYNLDFGNIDQHFLQNRGLGGSCCSRICIFSYLFCSGWRVELMAFKPNEMQPSDLGGTSGDEISIEIPVIETVSWWEKVVKWAKQKWGGDDGANTD